MSPLNTASHKLAILVGAGILAASTNSNIMQTGGYLTSHAVLVSALAVGVFAGASVIPKATGHMVLVILVGLIAGEAYNLFATGERIIIEREDAAKPLTAKLQAHDKALADLERLKHAKPSTVRLEEAKAARETAREAVEKEAQNIRCGKECERKQGLADKAEAELQAAITEAQREHQADLEEARHQVEVTPLPPSATPLADRLGWQPWALDLLMAACLSLGANGLAGVLIAYGAHAAPSASRVADAEPVQKIVRKEQETALWYLHPIKGAIPLTDGRSDSQSDGLSKAEALDDLMQRLAEGRPAFSQSELATAWRRPKQTVSEWLREWRNLGVIGDTPAAGRRRPVR